MNGDRVSRKAIDALCGEASTEQAIANGLGYEESTLLDDNSMVDVYLTPEERDERLTVIERYDFNLSHEDAELLIIDLLRFAKKALYYDETAAEILEDTALMEEGYYPRCRIVQATSTLIHENLASPRHDSEIPVPATCLDLDDMIAIHTGHDDILATEKLTGFIKAVIPFTDIPSGKIDDIRRRIRNNKETRVIGGGYDPKHVIRAMTAISNRDYTPQD